MAKSPRNVRPFWIEGSVDGSTTKIGTGPKALTGGMEFTVKMRENGAVSDCEVKISCRVVNGHAIMEVYPTADRTQGFEVITNL